METLYDIRRLRHIGQGCIYFYSGDDIEHLTGYARRQAAFGIRPLPIIVIDRDCRMYVDCPLYSPWEWIPKMISVSPPASFGFDTQDVLNALREITEKNDRVKEGIACDLVTIARVTSDDASRAGRTVLPALWRLSNRITRYARDGQTNGVLRLFHAGRPVPCRYFKETVMIVHCQYDGESIPFETYKEWEAEETRAGRPDEVRLPFSFRVSISALELFFKKRGIERFDIVNLETLRI